MFGEGARLVNQRARSPGQAGAIQQGEDHPTPADLPAERAHGAGAGHVKQHKNQVSKCRKGGEAGCDRLEGDAFRPRGLLGGGGDCHHTTL